MLNKLLAAIDEGFTYYAPFNSFIMASNNSSQNVFFVDQLARAFLVCCQVITVDRSNTLKKLLDFSIFEPKFTFDKLNAPERKQANESPVSSTSKKRVKKSNEKSSVSRTEYSNSA